MTTHLTAVRANTTKTTTANRRWTWAISILPWRKCFTGIAFDLGGGASCRTAHTVAHTREGSP